VSRKASIIAAGLILVASAAWAQEAQDKAVVTPLRVQVVLARYDGEKKVSSMPYTLSVNATARERTDTVSLRMGVQVPVPSTSFSETKGIVQSFTYRNVGTNIDAWASHAPNNRFTLHLGVEQTSIYGDELRSRAQSGPAAAGSQPVLRTFHSNFTVVLRDGETTQYVTATDPVSGEVLKIDVTLNVIK
jgi:hypothetical protein